MDQEPVVGAIVSTQKTVPKLNLFFLCLILALEVREQNTDSRFKVSKEKHLFLVLT